MQNYSFYLYKVKPFLLCPLLLEEEKENSLP